MHRARLVMKMKTRSSLGFKMLGGISADSSPSWCLCGGKIDCSGLACGYSIWVQFFCLMDQCQPFSSVWHLMDPSEKNQEESDPRAPCPWGKVGGWGMFHPLWWGHGTTSQSAEEQHTGKGTCSSPWDKAGSSTALQQNQERLKQWPVSNFLRELWRCSGGIGGISLEVTRLGAAW